jgi:hypothetical protein
MPGSDVLTLRGFFEQTPYFVLPANVDVSSGSVVITEQPVSPNGVIQELLPVADKKGIVLMGRNQYAVATVNGAGVISGTAPNRTLQIAFQGGQSDIWQALNADGTYVAPTFQVYRVGILQDYTYYVNPDGELRRWRAGPSGGTDEPVAQNIGSLQVALGLDINHDGSLSASEWFHSATTPGAPSNSDAASAAPLGLRITVLGRTPFPVMGWVQPTATFSVEDMTVPTGDSRRAKWRTLQVQAALRDFVL